MCAGAIYKTEVVSNDIIQFLYTYNSLPSSEWKPPHGKLKQLWRYTESIILLNCIRKALT
jgi:hypothetical protein